MGKLFDIVDGYRDRRNLSMRTVAERIGVASSTPGGVWKNPRSLPEVDTLKKISEVTETPYSAVLAAVLHDIKYLGHERYQPTAEEFASDLDGGRIAPVLPLPTKDATYTDTELFPGAAAARTAPASQGERFDAEMDQVGEEDQSRE